MKPVYITHTSAISPQPAEDSLLLEPLTGSTDGQFRVIEPDYTTVIPPLQLRRMSRILKMGVYTGMDCIAKAGIARPDGIITGTGKGSMTDTEKFVKELSEYREEALNPTPFILSTYNAINGAIALQTKATGYNQTFVHRGSSFEVSLYDAQLRLNTATDAEHYLVGCFDEMTPEYFFVKGKIGYWKKEGDPAQSLWQRADSTGTLAGEGAAFFMLHNKDHKAIAALHCIESSYRTAANELPGMLQRNLDKCGWPLQEVDMLVLGLNGDSRDAPFYNQLMDQVPAGVPVLAFKHLCGEYETSGGFALWLTCSLLQGQPLPEAAWYRKPGNPDFFPRRIVYYNHYRGLNHNLILLSPGAAARKPL